ncbi:MAG TPA: 4Fe-4S binding protein [Anaerolineae bacterium]|nr:4Fe-4S binding protein [Anaerolineae bacterium]
MGFSLRSIVYLLPQVWRVLRAGPLTVQFPFAPPELQEGYRGQVVVDAARCRGCSLCVRDCPAFALELEREGREEYRLIYHPDRCAYCGQCELSCQFGAIRLSNTFTRATADRDTLTRVLVDRRPSPPPLDE